MRSLFAVVAIAACLFALPQDARAAFVAMRAVDSSSPVIDAKYVCGRFDGTFTCKSVPGGTTARHKEPSAIVPDTGAQTTPDLSGPSPVPSTEGWGATTSQPPPSQPPSATAQSCPPNTELLGGNCVPYTARCTNGLALDALPQPCASMEEKQVCRPRADGMKDCCCITYSKF